MLTVIFLLAGTLFDSFSLKTKKLSVNPWTVPALRDLSGKMTIRIINHYPDG